MDLVSIWFTLGALIPFILSATGAVGWEINLIIFIAVSGVLMVCLRKVTKKFLLRNANEKTNLASLIGQRYRMLERTDFETLGSVKVNDVVWTAVGDKRQEIDAGDIVEIVRVQGNKLLVREIEEATSEKEKSEKIERAEKKVAPKKKTNKGEEK